MKNNLVALLAFLMTFSAADASDIPSTPTRSDHDIVREFLALKITGDASSDRVALEGFINTHKDRLPEDLRNISDDFWDSYDKISDYFEGQLLQTSSTPVSINTPIKKINDANNLIKIQKDKITQLESKIVELQNAVEKGKADIASFDAKIKELEQDKEKNAQKIKELRGKRLTLAKALQEKQQQLEKANKDLSSLRAKVMELGDTQEQATSTSTASSSLDNSVNQTPRNRKKAVNLMKKHNLKT